MSGFRDQTLNAIFNCFLSAFISEKFLSYLVELPRAFTLNHFLLAFCNNKQTQRARFLSFSTSINRMEELGNVNELSL